VTARWWGTFPFPSGVTLRWQVGGLRLVVTRSPREWRVSWWRDPHATAPIEVAQAATADALPSDSECVRAAFAHSADPLTLTPALADRAVVATPNVSFQVLPGEEVVAYVLAPLWVRVAVGPAARVVADVPIQRPPDTWFGVNTIEGELCFAARTELSLDPDGLGLPVPRAVTPVRMRNTGTDPLQVDRVRLPMPDLALFADSNGQLWTPEVRLERERGNLARVTVGTEAPAGATGPCTQVAPAREPAKDPTLVVAFSALFGR
jgi:hypothetical protein